MIILTRLAPSTFGLSWFGAASSTRARRETSESLPQDHELPREHSPCCGGYNEAFIVQYWASYSPRY